MRPTLQPETPQRDRFARRRAELMERLLEVAEGGLRDLTSHYRESAPLSASDQDKQP